MRSQLFEAPLEDGEKMEKEETGAVLDEVVAELITAYAWITCQC
jgi:hypothetical protein